MGSLREEIVFPQVKGIDSNHVLILQGGPKGHLSYLQDGIREPLLSLSFLKI